MIPENNWFKEVKLIHWFFTHRRFFKRLFILLLTIFNLVVWSIFFYHLILYIIYTPAYQAMLVELTKERIDWIAYHQLIAPSPLAVSNENVIFLGPETGRGGRYSFVAEIENPNERWFVRRLVYQFVWSGGESRLKDSFLLPGEKTYLFSLNEFSVVPPLDLKLEIRNISWQRAGLDQRQKISLLKELSFRVIKFVPSFEKESRIIPPSLQLEANNSSAYNFREVEVVIAAYQGKRIVGLERSLIRVWRRGEKRDLNLNFVARIDFVTEIVVVPRINFLEPEIFQP